MAVSVSQTVDIGYGRGRLQPEAAASVAQIDARLGRPLDVNSAYRDVVLQQQMYDAYQAYLRGGPYPGHGRALPPSQSVHCNGEAIDTDDTAWAWLLNEYGWRRTAADEVWHYEYFAGLNQHRGELASVGATPFDQLKEFLMALSDQRQEEIYTWIKGLAFGDFPKAATTTAGDQPIKWWLQALGNQGGATQALAQETKDRVRGGDQNGDMLQLQSVRLTKIEKALADLTAAVAALPKA